MKPEDFNSSARPAGRNDGPSDEDLLDWTQRETLKYFTDFAHPVSGMARERSNEVPGYGFGSDCVTTGGTGFGIMAMVAGTERGWMTKEDLINRLDVIVNFLEKADRFHGAFPHFLNGGTGKTIPFSAKDDGGDIVETSFLMMGLLSARQYLKNEPEATGLRNRVTSLYEDVEWSWYTNGEKQLYWHWSPKNGFDMNLPVQGWNECLVTHVLAAASPTHPVSEDIYRESWTQGADFRNGADYGGVTLPLGPDRGGPLFFAHYSFMGLNPKELQDEHANYFQQNRAHALVNYNHAVKNPAGHKGYGPECWGLTACDGPAGYTVASPANDTGVIAPTAALSSFPYTPRESMAALRHFHANENLKSEYGFADAFSANDDWVADSNLAIDQGPIVVMIENYRSGLLWNMFMSAPEVQTGLDKLGFEAPATPPALKLEPMPENRLKPPAPRPPTDF